jgi:hypothetical protein
MIATSRPRIRVIVCGVFLVLWQLGALRAGIPMALSGLADFLEKRVGDVHRE